MSAILYCHIQLFIGDLRWHRASGRGRCWRLKLRCGLDSERNILNVKITTFLAVGHHLFYCLFVCVCVCVCVYLSLSHCIHLVIFRYLIFWFQITMALLEGRMVAKCWMGKDLEGSNRDLLEVLSWTTREGLRWAITKISQDIRCPSYRHSYLLGDI
jgi:hypothetical protein